ncbi:MAG: tetratricopeptide (TPR) repeat protein [Acidimicrobiales bacterium]|jgi:tetratricopeptide (TPR) repeat protein
MLRLCVEKVPADHTLRVAVLTTLAAQHFGEYEDLPYCKQLYEEARAAATNQGDQTLLAAVSIAEFHRFQRTWSFEERKTSLDQALELARYHGLLMLEIATRRFRVVLALDAGDMTWAADEVQAIADIARMSPEPLHAMQADVARIALTLLTGRLDQAEHDVSAALEKFQRFGPATLDQLGLQFALVARERGRLTEVEGMLRWKLEGYPGPAYAGPLAAILTSMGRYDEATALIGQYRKIALTSGGEGVLRYITPAFFAEAVADLGDAQRAVWLYDALLPADRRAISMFAGTSIYGSGSYYLGRLATVLGRYEVASEHLAAAHVHHQQMGALPYRLRTLLADVELATAQKLDPSSILDEARALAEDLGMQWLVDALVRRLNLG